MVAVNKALDEYELFVAEHLQSETAEHEVIRFARCIHRNAEKPHEDFMCCPRDDREDYMKRCIVLSSKAHVSFANLRAMMSEEEYETFAKNHFRSRGISKRFYRRMAYGIAAAASLAVLYYLYPSRSNLREPVLPENARRALEFLEKLGISDAEAASLLDSIKNHADEPVSSRWYWLKSSLALALYTMPFAKVHNLLLGMFFILQSPLTWIKNISRSKQWHAENRLRSLLYSAWDRDKHDRFQILEFWI